MRKILLLILITILTISCTACNNKTKQEITKRENLINVEKLYKEGFITENKYINNSINLEINIPKEYIILNEEETSSLDSEISNYELFGQTKTEDASISIISININEKSSASLYLSEIKRQLKEQNKGLEKSKNIILNEEKKVISNKAIYSLYTKTLIDNEYYHQDYHCTKHNDKIFCIISIYNEKQSELNNTFINSIKEI